MSVADITNRLVDLHDKSWDIYAMYVKTFLEKDEPIPQSKAQLKFVVSWKSKEMPKDWLEKVAKTLPIDILDDVIPILSMTHLEMITKCKYVSDFTYEKVNPIMDPWEIIAKAGGFQEEKVLDDNGFVQNGPQFKRKQEKEQLPKDIDSLPRETRTNLILGFQQSKYDRCAFVERITELKGCHFARMNGKILVFKN